MVVMSDAALSAQLVALLQKNKWCIRCVESCTAGALTAALGAVSGVSSVLDRSWITYSNQAKHEEVGVPLGLIAAHGAVSAQVVTAMAEGAVMGCDADTMAISISGIAGPSGGTSEKPVGTVWLGLKMPQQKVVAQGFLLQGDRQAVRQQAVVQALHMAVSAALLAD